ncbi:hypothetical protein N0V93_009134 [Gnomoniopsis smithogilvyi]|uniref:AAA+ ATPase domain-containing protein n=1 Tax=Gnomoniopsis smithogilvyi TaxID=1191159 RepID=A0A9W8YJX7_9PEZI|nr:hypothetical protein N0V93_009134 [Gnomoniopsis smithogilvyi]
MSSNIASSHYEAWQAWQNHSSGNRQDTGLIFASILRSSYENHHVIRVNDDSFDLQGFASAGFATWTDEHFDLYDAKRAFSDPGSRSGEVSGSLKDTTHFGRARYEWKDKGFIVYTTMFTDNWMRGAQKALFILAPCSDEVVDDHHTDIDALLLACGSWTKELHGEIFVFDQARWSKSKDLYKSVESSSWDDVILHPDTKSKLIEDIQGFFENEGLYKSFDIPWKRGVILHGVPGNGKTISIKALINSLSKREPEAIASLYVKSLDHCNGPRHSIQMIFSKARNVAPCVLIFEDLDSMVTDKVRSYFLNEIDGLESNDGILMIGSTNHLDRLDPAIAKRPSRFDRKYHFKLPDEDERVLYCQYWHQKLLNHPLVTFPEDMCFSIAKFTDGFSFAYLKELFISSLLIVARGATSEDAASEQSAPSDHSSTIDTVLVEAPTEEEIGKERDSRKFDKVIKVTASRKPQIRRAIPKVEIPEELQGNTLLSVILAQAQILLNEMDKN